MGDHAATVRAGFDFGSHPVFERHDAALAALDALVAERDLLAAALAAAEPALDETIAWIDTDTIGCVDVAARAERALRDVRDALAKVVV